MNDNITREIEIYKNRYCMKTHDADGARLSELITKAKGKRSLRKFAEEIETNPSTLSRLINLQTTEASDELIIKIGIFADKDSGVTVEELMEAHGKVSRAKNLTQIAAEYEKKCHDAIMSNLLERGYKVESTFEKWNSFGYRYDFVISTDALDGTDSRWAFDVKLGQPLGILGPAGSGRSRKLLDSVFARFYLEDGLYDRVSIVVNERVMFEQLKQCLLEFSIKDSFSIILVAGTTVVEEFVVNNTKNQRVVFERRGC